jgi:hypothetical protein
MEKALELLKGLGFIDGNLLPDATPGHKYHFRSCRPNIIVPSPSARQGITRALTDDGIKYRFKSGIITLY